MAFFFRGVAMGWTGGGLVFSDTSGYPMTPELPHIFFGHWSGTVVTNHGFVDPVEALHDKRSILDSLAWECMVLMLEGLFCGHLVRPPGDKLKFSTAIPHFDG